MAKFIKTFFYLLFILLVLLLIMTETNYLNNKHLFFEKSPILSIILGSLGLWGIMILFPTKTSNRVFYFLLILSQSLFIIFILLLIFIEASVANFSGMTFGTEFFYHFEWQAFVLGVKEYTLEFILFLVFILITVLIMVNKVVFKSVKINLIFLGIAITMLASYFETTVVARFYNGVADYRQSLVIPDSQIQDVNKFNDLGIQASNLTKNDIDVTAKSNENIIVIYLESFSHIFTTSERYPDLTPNLNALKKKHGELTSYHSTAGFTMDGLISSNCGFLPNMALGNNSFTGETRPYFNMPCATDVLHTAGYYQEFIGGANKNFSNKAAFLTDHGYDEIWGWEDFKQQERFKKKGSKNWWGLHDDDLFKVAQERIIALQAKQPFNISIMTLSTHLNGYPSPSCEKYNESADKYINAIHCLDQLVGKFIRDLQRKDLLKNTKIIISADHGVFNTALTQKLFGTEISSKKILGIIMDGDNNNIDRSIALYDLGSYILDVLGIQHNVQFILAGAFKKTTENRLLFSRKQIFTNGEWSYPDKNCGSTKDNKFELPIDYCEWNKILKTTYGFTNSFGKKEGIKYNIDSSFLIQFSDVNGAIKDVVLNGKSLIRYMRRNGFVVKPKHLIASGINLLFINPEEHKVFSFLNFDTGQKSHKRILAVIKKYKDYPFVLYSNQLFASLNLVDSLKQRYQLTCINNHICTKNLSSVADIQYVGEHSHAVINFQ